MDLTSHVNVAGCVFQPLLLKALCLVASALCQATSGSRHLCQGKGEGKESSGHAELSAGTLRGQQGPGWAGEHPYHKCNMLPLTLP